MLLLGLSAHWKSSTLSVELSESYVQAFFVVSVVVVKNVFGQIIAVHEVIITDTSEQIHLHYA